MMEVQPQLETFVLFTLCLASTPNRLQQEEKIKMCRADSHGNLFHNNIMHFCPSACVDNWTRKKKKSAQQLTNQIILWLKWVCADSVSI